MRTIRAVLLFGLLTSSVVLFAQPGDPGGGGNPTPISGIEILLGGGALMGIRKFLQKNKSGKDSQ
ncbi:MAG TPA: hypothetical protein PKM91_17640 [Cyclobacteriaceae bacterium]|jgi:hypothetical protein|nr:hypothetical protein [Cyclobacteriaceae bacterium]